MNQTLHLKYGTDTELCVIDKFPAGEPRVVFNQDIGDVFSLTMQKFDYPLLACVVDALRRLNPEVEIDLFLPYFPAARQDRVCNVGESLSVRVYADMINVLNFNSVTIMDAHSTVALAVLNHVCEIAHGVIYVNSGQAPRHGLTNILKEFWHDSGKPEKFVVVAPDKGANKKVQDLINRFKDDLNEFEKKPEVIFGQGDKTRNLETGELTGFTFDLGEEINELDIIICDDINCNGGTFLGLKTKIQDIAPDSFISLYTTHSDCVRGVNNITEEFYTYYTTNSEWGVETNNGRDNLKVYNVFN